MLSLQLLIIRMYVGLLALLYVLVFCISPRCNPLSPPLTIGYKRTRLLVCVVQRQLHPMLGNCSGTHGSPKNLRLEAVTCGRQPKRKRETHGGEKVRLVYKITGCAFTGECPVPGRASAY
jgi:hypothetical protein